MLPMSDFIERLDKNLKPYLRTVIRAEEKKRIHELSEQRGLKSIQKLSFVRSLAK
jgi:hypothetical protein